MMWVMTDDLYERYKEALRNGHIAVLRGSLQEAIEAYRFASQIAPSRAAPHSALGGVYIRLGKIEEALAQYAAAVASAPRDEGALLGQAEALLSAGRRPEAAAVLDRVVEIQDAAGRLPEASDTLRRAIELEESQERTRRQRSLVRQIRFSAGDRAAEQQLAKALRLREEPVQPEETPATTPIGRRLASAGSARTEPGLVRELEVEPMSAEERARLVAGAEVLPVVEVDTVAEAAEAEAVAEAEPAAAVRVVAEAEAVAVATAEQPAVGRFGGAGAAAPPDEREAVGVMIGLDEIAFPESHKGNKPQPTGDQLLAEVEAAEAAGNTSVLQSLLTRTARTYAREGRFEAGLDAAHRLLQLYPSDVDAHLVLVEVYLARHWDSLAAEKLLLLGRIAELNDDKETRKRLGAVASRAFPTDRRLEALYS
jgi:hypothetical protein